MASNNVNFSASSDEDQGANDKDGDYFPESVPRQTLGNSVMESTTKLKFLMDQIDGITRKLSVYQLNKEQISGHKRQNQTENEDEQDLVSADTSLYTQKLTQQPANIAGGTMRDYQLEGLNWLLKMHDCKINGVLADEMGLGKTLQTISILAYLAIANENQENRRPHLVIVPKGTLANWSNEFKVWCPALQVFEFYGNVQEREQLRPKIPRTNTYNVMLTTYEIAMIEKSILRPVSFDYLVIDEAHRIKNEKSVLSKVVRIFNSQHRLLLTGTPLQNNLHELWALLNFLMPTIFSSANDFDEWFNITNPEDQSFIVQQLHKILRPFMIRRLKSEVETRLPDKKEFYVFLPMTPMQRDLYKRVITKNIDVVNGQGERSQLMNTIMQLRKVCNHPYLFEGLEPGPPYIDGEHLVKNCMKFLTIDKLLPKLLSLNSKVLIFTQMTRLLDILDDFLQYRGYKYCRIDGSTHHLDRQNQIEQFQDPESDIRIFILSTRAGGIGINLHAANTVIIFDSDWNPQVDMQAMDRAHRIGQTKEVTVYRLVSEGTVEEKIVERAAKKLKMDHLIIQRGSLAQQNRAPSIQEMNNIVQFGAQQVLKSTEDKIEEDIDKILEYASNKTNEMNTNLQKLEDKFNLSSFSLDGTTNFYDFEGETYVQKQKEHISIGPRERRTTGFYDIDKYFNTMNNKRGKKKGWRNLVGGGHPHQFFPEKPLDALDEKEEKWLEAQANPKRGKKVEKFTEKDKAQRAQLLSTGFPTWSKKDFTNFIKGCETYGRSKLASINEFIGTKTIEEVTEYAAYFWENYTQLPNGVELVGRVQNGEDNIVRVKSIKRTLKKVFEKHTRDQIEINLEDDDSNFESAEDRYLTYLVYKYGHGNWDVISNKIKTKFAFRFNFWMLTRSQSDLSERFEKIYECLEAAFGDGKSLEPKLEKKIKLEVTPEYNWIIHFN